jgi:4-hydroxy-4-methyl-2-oxoglutarate aldolase
MSDRNGSGLVADDDGVIFVPREVAPEVAKRALAREVAEADKIAQFRYGVLGLDLYGMRETLARLRVTYVDDPAGDDTPDVAADARAGQS